MITKVQSNINEVKRGDEARKATARADKRLKKITRYSRRNSQGALSSAILSLVLLSTFALGAMSFDFAHMLSVKAQLQNATDAAALAGARDMANRTVVPASLYPQAIADATAVAAANSANGVSVSNASAGTTVTVTCPDLSWPPQVLMDPTNTSPPIMDSPVTVTATQQVTSIFAKLLNNNSNIVSATSTAMASTGISSLDPSQALNIGVSLNWAPPAGPQAGTALSSIWGPLWSSPVGQSFTVDLETPSNCNAAWISNWTATQSPRLDYFQTNITLNNGTGTVSGLQPGDTIMLPVFQGNPPFNYSTQVIGILGLKVTAVNLPKSITGTIVQPICYGTRGIPGSSSIWQVFTQAWQITLWR